MGQRRAWRIGLGLTLALLAGCRSQSDDGWQWQLPTGFPEPRVPADNPMNAAKVELGRRLFYDKRLSQNGTQACATCHKQELGFSDGRAHALGSTGQEHRRNSMALTNVAYASRLTWANPHLDRLEHQALVPMFGDNPIELGLVDEQTLVDRLRADVDLSRRFAEAFPGEAEPVRVENVTRAIAAFQRTLISGDSPYDRYVHGERDALSPAAIRGMELFFSERLECFHCHGGFNFADSVDHAKMPEPERAFHNTGLYNVDGKGAYPATDEGLLELTEKPTDMGRFKAPTLRNIAVSAPYMHDGSVATLSDAITHYAEAGRTIDSGANAGSGATSPLKDELLVGFVLTDAERADVITFLESLTDTQFLSDPRFADPELAPRRHEDTEGN